MEKMREIFEKHYTSEKMPKLIDGTGKAIDAFMQEIANKRVGILEAFMTAYMAETGLLPSQVQFCFQIDHEMGIEKVWIEKLPDDRGAGI
jgi:hypothetical protein